MKKLKFNLVLLIAMLLQMVIIPNVTIAQTTEPISFDAYGVVGLSLNNPTSLELGPDGRLYVSQQNGMLYAYEIERTSTPSYEVVSTESINLVQNIPNHNDDGTDSTQSNRQVTGLVTAGTAENPVLYVSSSDPRISVDADSGLDTNSGIISRLTWNGSSWDKVDIVRGLPRSEENHSTNGMDLDETSNILYIAQGGHTNKGAPASNFAGTPEYYLSGAILSVDLDAIEAMTVWTDQRTSDQFIYDLPTLDDPERTNITNSDPAFPYPSGHPLYNEEVDPGDPFGGNNGSNMAVVGTSGPVQVYSPGFRNPYDVLFTTFGELYTYDNGPNTGWGGLPVTYDSGDLEKDNSLYDPSAGDYCTNEFNEDGSSGHADTLHHIASAGYYGGHPAPIRAFPEDAGIYIYEESGGSWTEAAMYTLTNNLPTYLTDFDATPNTVECEYDILSKSLADVNASTNGLAEYTASNFGGAMQGDLLAASFDGNIYRYQLNDTNDAVDAEEALFGGFGSTPLDVTTQGDAELFPGTVWAATYGSNDITVFEPTDFGTCEGTYDASLDEDGDGYDNADEIDNGTDPCSAGSQPPDFDDDGTSDLNDPDDDNDGILDINDAFAIDSDNGLATQLPVNYPFDNNDPGTGFFGLGFTGLMTNGVDDYLDLYDPTTIAAGGASGKMTVEEVTAGDAYQTPNNQENGFQFGIDVDTNDRPFIIHTNLESPFFNGDAAPQNYQSFGMIIGDGSQSNYLKVVMNANGGDGGVEVGLEVADIADNTQYGNAVWGGAEILLASSVDLYLEVDPQSLTAQPRVSIDGGITLFDLGSPLSIPAAWLDPNDDLGMAVGLISTSFNSGETFAATWDFINIEYIPTDAEAFVGVTLDGGINASSYSSGSFEITNQSPSQDIDSVTIDLSDSLLPDIVFDPDGTAGDTTSKCLVIDSGAVDTGYVAPTDNCVDPFSLPHQNGYYAVTLNFDDFNPAETLTFSVDVDPTSIQGSSAPGPGESGSVSGLELTGSAVTVEFSDLATFVSDLYRQPLSDGGGQVTLNDNLPAAPVINLDGLSTPITTNDPNQSVTISGPADAEVALLVAEAAFFEPTGGAFDPDLYEGNSVVDVNEYTATLDGSGSATIAVTLTNMDPTAADTYGLNYMTAVVVDPDGVTSPTSNIEVVEYDPNYDPIEVLYRVNNGGPQIAAADASDPDWSEDQVTSGAGNAAVTGTPSPYVNSDEIAPHSYGVTNTIDISSLPAAAAAAPMELFQMERWDDDTAPEMQWDFPVPEGTEVEVRLYLAEIFDGITGTGQRVFDVSVEGMIPTEFNDLDPYALGGGLFIGSMVSTTTTVTDGDNLDLDFIHITENPAVKGIEIIQTAPAPLIPTVTITSPSDGDVFFTDTVDVTWVSSDLTPEVHHAHLYVDTTDYAQRISPLPLDHTYAVENLTPGDHFVIVKLSDENHIEIEGAEDRVDFTVQEPGTPEALIQVNPGGDLFASTYTSGSFQIQNTGDTDIVSVTLDLSTAWMMDVVFDPEGTAGDAAGKCLVADSGATATGFVTPSDPCTEPFSDFHNGTDADDGYNVLTLNFNDFNPGETFTFSTDLDPTSIKDATDTGDAGSISGFEIIGAAVSVGFSGDLVIESNLYDEGSPGGSAALVTSTEAPAPVIEMQGVTPPTILGQANQTILITGTPGANFSILQPVARLYLDDVTPGYDIDPFESNEALAKSIYSGTFDGSGNASVPVTLFIEASPDAGPDAPLNHFIAVEENADGDFGLTSNSFVVEYIPEQEVICINAGGDDYTTAGGQFFMADAYFTAATGGVYSVTEPISGTEDDTLFQTERYGDPFSYEIPVINGDYTVELMFAELYHGVAAGGGAGEPGDRIFSVDLEGGTVLSDYDIIAEAGAPLTAITETFNTTVTDGSIDLTFYLGTTGVDNAKVSAICVKPANVPPTADAGPDQTVNDDDNSGAEDVTLDGSGSSDSDGEIVSYDWSWSMGGTTGVNPTVSLPVGTHTITLTVTDDAGATDTDTVTITVNEPPTADAGEDQTVTDLDGNGDEEVTLDGSGSSDNDGSIVSYSWSEGGSEIATGVNPTVTLTVGTHTITLTVTDDDGATDTDTVTITFNEPPTADAGEDQTVADANDSGDEEIMLDGSGSSDSDGSIVSYSWNDGSGEIATGVNPTVTLPVGTHNITLTVTDNDGGTDTDTVIITITSFVNEPPTADAGMDQTVTDADDSGDEDVTLDGSGSSDNDGSIASYSWSDGNGEIATGVNPTVTLSVGTHTITLTVTDDDGATDTDTVTIVVESAPTSEYYFPIFMNLEP